MRDIRCNKQRSAPLPYPPQPDAIYSPNPDLPSGKREKKRHTDNEGEKVKALAAPPINPSGFENDGAGVCPAFPSGLSGKGTLTPRLRPNFPPVFVPRALAQKHGICVQASLLGLGNFALMDLD